MGFKEIVSLDSDVTIALGGTNRKTNKKNPTSVEGFYLGSRTVTSKKSKTGEAKIHYFQTSKGNVGVWGKTDMDRKMGTAIPGAMTRITFDKMKPTPNGDMYTYKVAQDNENTIDVSAFAGSSNESASEEVAAEQESYGSTDNDADAEAEEDEDQEDDGPDEDALQAQALAVAERKAKVQNLLNGKGKANTKN